MKRALACFSVTRNSIASMLDGITAAVTLERKDCAVAEFKSFKKISFISVRLTEFSTDFFVADKLPSQCCLNYCLFERKLMPQDPQGDQP